MPETMRLLGSTDKNSKYVPHLEIAKVLLMHCNIVNNDYQQDSRTLYAFVSNTSFGELLDIPPKILVFLKSFDSEFSHIEVWLTH